MKATLEKFKSLKLVRIMGFNRVVLIGVIIVLCLIFQVLTVLITADHAYFPLTAKLITIMR